MAEVKNGRFAAKIDGDFVVFLIGMRINQLWAVNKWLPVSRGDAADAEGVGKAAGAWGCWMRRGISEWADGDDGAVLAVV